jgi:glycosyltransferase involved in cell wall biosynthesis
MMSADAPTYLWLTRWPPYPPRRGGDIDYSRELLASLARLAPVRALAFGDPDDAPAGPPGVEWRLVAHREPPRVLSLVSSLPNVAFRHLSRAYLDAAVEAAEGTSAVLVDFIGLLWVVGPLRAALRRRGGRVPKVVAIDHNFEHGVRRQMVAAEPRLTMKALLALDAFKAGRLERRANQIADGLIPNTPADAERFAEITDKPMAVVMPGYAGVRAAPRLITPDIPPRIAIVGNHQAQHKRMVLEQTLGALAAAGIEKQYIVDIVGARDQGDFARRFPGFNFLGYVEDLEAYLKTVRLALAPDEIGGGFKHRVLTHAFHRTPILAVRWAVNGMGLREGVDYAAADDLAELAAAIPALMDDFERLNRLQAAAFEHCEHAFDWNERGRVLHAFLQGLAEPGPASA